MGNLHWSQGIEWVLGLEMSENVERWGLGSKEGPDLEDLWYILNKGVTWLNFSFVILRAKYIQEETAFDRS